MVHSDEPSRRLFCGGQACQAIGMAKGRARPTISDSFFPLCSLGGQVKNHARPTIFDSFFPLCRAGMVHSDEPSRRLFCGGQACQAIGMAKGRALPTIADSFFRFVPSAGRLRTMPALQLSYFCAFLWLIALHYGVQVNFTR
jgi:hypothetical protein